MAMSTAGLRTFYRGTGSRRSEAGCPKCISYVLAIYGITIMIGCGCVGRYVLPATATLSRVANKLWLDLSTPI